MKATMTSFDANGMQEWPCEVAIRDQHIVVSYAEDDGSAIEWNGHETAPGHYSFHQPELRGRATLHRWPADSLTFEGSWVEAGYLGMWQIDIEEESEGYTKPV